jgi:hypothetical protein
LSADLDQIRKLVVFAREAIDNRWSRIGTPDTKRIQLVSLKARYLVNDAQGRGQHRCPGGHGLTSVRQFGGTHGGTWRSWSHKILTLSLNSAQCGAVETLPHYIAWCNETTSNWFHFGRAMNFFTTNPTR